MHIDRGSRETDKWDGLLEIYDRVFAPFRNKAFTLLELGVLTGGSLRLWHDTFPHAIIVGLDLEPVLLEPELDRLRIYQGSQSDLACLDRVAAIEAPGGFDIVIDDASHVAHSTRASFWHLFRHHLKGGGIFSIEDWGTGYWDAWPDGRHYDWHADSPLRNDWSPGPPPRQQKVEYPSHQFGMVGMVKELVDEVARDDITRNDPADVERGPSLIASLEILAGVVVIRKAQDPAASL